jgi:hypothetical protein
LNGINCIGFEINPYAALACNVKLNSPRLDLGTLEAYCREYRKVAGLVHPPAVIRRPAEFQTRIPFFSPSVEEQVLVLLDFVERIPYPEIADLFRVAFGSVMVSFSNYTYEPSLGSRPGAGKPLIENADVHSAIARKLSEMVSDICWVKERVGSLRSVEGQVYNLDFLASEDVLPPGSVDAASQWSCASITLSWSRSLPGFERRARRRGPTGGLGGPTMSHPISMTAIASVVS